MAVLGLQESEELPADFTNLFDQTLFKYDTSLIPEAKGLYTVRACVCACMRVERAFRLAEECTRASASCRSWE